MRTPSELEKIFTEKYFNSEIDIIVEMIGELVDSDNIETSFMTNHFIALGSAIGKKIDSLQKRFSSECTYNELNHRLEAFEWHLYCSDTIWYIEKKSS